MGKVAPERTNWRDEWISKKHREWGVACQATDIDWLVIEHDGPDIAGLIEYKDEHAKILTPDAIQYKVLQNLGDRAELPVFCVRYFKDDVKFEVTSINGLANKKVPTVKLMSEREYVRFLYKLRNINATDDFLSQFIA